jgi:hypothetical protein
MSDEPRGKVALSVNLSVSNMPELIASLRRELADILREAARGEPPATAARLRKIADLYETGLREE